MAKNSFVAWVTFKIKYTEGTKTLILSILKDRLGINKYSCLKQRKFEHVVRIPWIILDILYRCFLDTATKSFMWIHYDFPWDWMSNKEIQCPTKLQNCLTFCPALSRKLFASLPTSIISTARYKLEEK